MYMSCMLYSSGRRSYPGGVRKAAWVWGGSGTWGSDQGTCHPCLCYGCETTDCSGQQNGRLQTNVQSGKLYGRRSYDSPKILKWHRSMWYFNILLYYYYNYYYYYYCFYLNFRFLSFPETIQLYSTKCWSTCEEGRVWTRVGYIYANIWMEGR